MPQQILMAEQLHVSQQPQNDVFAYENHVLFRSYVVNDYVLQQLMCICLTCNCRLLGFMNSIDNKLPNVTKTFVDKLLSKLVKKCFRINFFKLHYYQNGVQFTSLNHYGTLKVK
jgi:hypothetical protein